MGQALKLIKGSSCMSEYESKVVDRLDGISDKIGELTTAIIKLQANEIGNRREVESANKKIEEVSKKNTIVSEKLHTLELKMSETTTVNTTNLKWIQKGIWVLVGGVIASVVAYFKTKGP